MNESKARDTLDRILKVAGKEETCPKCDVSVLRVCDDSGRPLVLNHNGAIHWPVCTASTRLATLMRLIGKAGECSSCGSAVRWVKTKADKNAIYNPDGISHWATCPSADDHRKTKGDIHAATTRPD